MNRPLIDPPHIDPTAAGEPAPLEWAAQQRIRNGDANAPAMPRTPVTATPALASRTVGRFEAAGEAATQPVLRHRADAAAVVGFPSPSRKVATLYEAATGRNLIQDVRELQRLILPDAGPA
jgi:hypothetical protein